MKRLQDIADQVGVSRTTVSNVLHGNTKKVSKEMIRKISEILNQEGYVPDTSSRGLTRKGSCIIGLVLGYSCVHGIPALRDTFVAELLSGVEETAHRNGYYVMLIDGQDKNTDQVAEIASRWNVDGLVVLGLDEKKYKELRRQLNKYMVLIDTYPEAEYHYVNVGIDDFGGGAMVAKYLLDNGYTQAIFAASDVVAPGLVKALREYDIQIPWDLGVITLNNTSLSRLSQPPLSSVEVFLQENADAAALCMELLWQKKIHPKQIIISCRLEESVRPPLSRASEVIANQYL